MNDTILNDLIVKLNNITNSHKYLEILTQLGLSVSNFELEENKIKLKEFDYISFYTSKIVKIIENKLSDIQKEYFYSKLNSNLIKYISNEKAKYQVIKEELESGKFKNYDGEINHDFVNLFSSLENDVDKVTFIEKFKKEMEEEDISRVLSTLSTDNLKLKYLNLLVADPESFGSTVLSMDDDNLKLTLYENNTKLLNDGKVTYEKLVSTLKNDDLKIQIIDNNYKSNKKISSYYEKLLIYGLNQKESLLQIWDKINLENRLIIIYKIKDEKERVRLLKQLNNSFSEKKS